MKYVPDTPFTSEVAAKDFLKKYIASQSAGYDRMAVIRKSDGAWLGWCGLKHDKSHKEVDLGYRFFSQYWGQGYATESSIASLIYGFDQLGLQKIIARVATENTASIKVVKKCGFSYKGRFAKPDWKGLLHVLDKEDRLD